MKNKIDAYIVKYPSARNEGYCFYKAYKTRSAARKACVHLIKDLGLEHALLCSVHGWPNFEYTIIREEVFL